MLQAMTPWLNRGAKKTNEPTIPLILQAFGWLNRAALARARPTAPAPRPRMIDRSPPNRNSKLRRRPAAAQAVPTVGPSVSAKPAASRARGFGANKVNAPLYC